MVINEIIETSRGPTRIFFDEILFEAYKYAKKLDYQAMNLRLYYYQNGLKESGISEHSKKHIIMIKKVYETTLHTKISELEQIAIDIALNGEKEEKPKLPQILREYKELCQKPFAGEEYTKYLEKRTNAYQQIHSAKKLTQLIPLTIRIRTALKEVFQMKGPYN